MLAYEAARQTSKGNRKYIWRGAWMIMPQS